MSAEVLRVLIAEDHAVVREGTRDILERDLAIRVVGEAEDGEQALQQARVLQPDIAVLDVRLPILSGVEVARRLKDVSPNTKTLMLSAYDDDDYVFAAMEAGASGYLLKIAHGSEVIAAIHAISRGEVVLGWRIAAKVLAAGHRNGYSAGQEDHLTQRELDILRLAARGLRNKEIAIELQLSRRTVEGHLSHIFSKLCVSSRTEAIVQASARGLIALPNAN